MSESTTAIVPLALALLPLASTTAQEGLPGPLVEITRDFERAQAEWRAPTARRADAATADREAASWPALRAPLHTKPFLDRCLMMAANAPIDEADRYLVWILDYACAESL